MVTNPREIQDLAERGQRALGGGDLTGARSAYERLAQIDGRNPQHWIKLAIACRGLNDAAGEEAAITRALSLDPMDFVALILRANLLERTGRRHEAAIAYSAAAAVAPPMERLHPDLRPALAHAAAFREAYGGECASYLDEYLAPHLAHAHGVGVDRFRDSLDILVGRKRRYDSLSAIFHYPHLPAIEFFDRSQFPWLDALEAATDDIRDEFIEVLKGEEGFAPYIAYPPDVPHNQWAELNNSPRWSAFHFYKMGEKVEANAAKCPRTMKALEGAPQPVQPGRTPSAMFSLLKPRTHIPAHNGVTNTRLVVHLPLIVPEGCRFRVGNETRQWVPGRAWVFDDTLEHEAWNDSDKLRVVLIFDIWHPHLSEDERRLVTALSAGLNAFTGGAGRFEL